MAFFSWQEILQISKRIACDTFVKHKRLMNECDYIKSPDSEPHSKKADNCEQQEPDFEQYIIKARNPIELEKERRDDLNKKTTNQKNH